MEVVAVEELRYARTKRFKSWHLFVCPKLMLPRWLRALSKVSDVMLDMCVGQGCWGEQCHEPLMVVICFPFIHRSNWQSRNVPVPLHLSRMIRLEGEGSTHGANLETGG